MNAKDFLYLSLSRENEIYFGFLAEFLNSLSQGEKQGSVVLKAL